MERLTIKSTIIEVCRLHKEKYGDFNVVISFKPQSAPWRGMQCAITSPHLETGIGYASMGECYEKFRKAVGAVAHTATEVDTPSVDGGTV